MEFGVVGRVQDDLSHTDKQMYSCGLLAPKMRRGGCGKSEGGVFVCVRACVRGVCVFVVILSYMVVYISLVIYD